MHRSSMLAVMGLIVSIVACSAASARRPAPPEPAPPPVPALPPSPTVAPPLGGPLPRDPGPLPAGLAHASAQGCAACHGDIVDAWEISAHAGPLPASVRATAAGDTRCVACHLPLAQQHATLATGAPNPAWQPTLAAEGVTCVACHLSEGHLVGPRPATRPGPHPVAVRDDLGTAEACGTCHQLAWSGAEKPLYDTVGEWSRSDWAAAGVGCTDCHAQTAGHAMPARLDRALSVLVELAAPRIVRGAPPVQVRLILQNTGAGHSVPTGTPFRGLRVEAVLVPVDAGADSVVLWTGDLSAHASADPPFSLGEDTRLVAGDTRAATFPAVLDARAPSGAYHLRVRVHRTLHGVVDVPDALVRNVQVTVE